MDSDTEDDRGYEAWLMEVEETYAPKPVYRTCQEALHEGYIYKVNGIHSIKTSTRVSAIFHLTCLTDGSTVSIYGPKCLSRHVYKNDELNSKVVKYFTMLTGIRYDGHKQVKNHTEYKFSFIR